VIHLSSFESAYHRANSNDLQLAPRPRLNDVTAIANRFERRPCHRVVGAFDAGRVDAIAQKLPPADNAIRWLMFAYVRD
jgi:hypothetical protein